MEDHDTTPRPSTTDAPETEPELHSTADAPALDKPVESSPVTEPVEPKSPEKPQAHHDHSDSLVTVRLSEANSSVSKEEDMADAIATRLSGEVHDETVTRPVSEEHHEEEEHDERTSDSEDEARPEDVTLTRLDEQLSSAIEKEDDDIDAQSSTTESTRESLVSTSETEETPSSPTDSTIQAPSPSTEEPAKDVETEEEAAEAEHTEERPASTEPEKPVREDSLKAESTRSRSFSMRSSNSSGSNNVDWAALDDKEEQEKEDEGTDESTAFLLARLEQENNALAHDPKAGISIRDRAASRPPSYQQLKKLVTEPPQQSNLRYSLLPSPPPMTELEFWSALVRNYPQTAQRLPTLTANKIQRGVPPPLRGVVWQSIAGARDTALEEAYDRLSVEPGPYDKLIHKDIGRSFPGVDMFRDPEGEGQKMLGRVLNAFSQHDQEIGYCQGLGFVVGPLLMHMGDKESFCILVRLMEHYDLRSCYLPDLSGLHLRIFQFQNLLNQHLPELTGHLEKLAVEPLYLSQWFLSFFGVTCPLPMLFRIYDVILAEGASETLMRVALSLMKRNEGRILAATEFEDVMQLLLSRAMWDTYSCNADDLVQDFCSWNGLVTRESLDALEAKFRNSQSQASAAKPSVHSAAARFLGRFWAGSSSSSTKSPTSPPATSLTAPNSGRPASTVRRSPSKQSMASTLNSIESTESTLSLATDATTMSRQPSADWAPAKAAKAVQNKDKGLHNQIEDLLTALSDLQREHSQLASQLQREREERDEDRNVVKKALSKLKGESVPKTDDDDEEADEEDIFAQTETAINELEQHFDKARKSRSSLMLHTKQQLRDESQRWKVQYNEELARSTEIGRQLLERDREVTRLKGVAEEKEQEAARATDERRQHEQEAARTKEELREARARVKEMHREQQKLETANRDLRKKKTDSAGAESTSSATGTPSGGLRELKLGRSFTSVETTPTKDPVANMQRFSKRVSSLSTHNILATEDHKPADEDALLLELVQAKTAEAVAKQELEEVKAKLDAFKKMLSGNASASPALTKTLSGSHRLSPPSPSGVTSAAAKTAAEEEKEKKESGSKSSPGLVNAAGGFFSGWGKKSISISTSS